jgi:hypothetical protein
LLVPTAAGVATLIEPRTRDVHGMNGSDCRTFIA